MLPDQSLIHNGSRKDRGEANHGKKYWKYQGDGQGKGSDPKGGITRGNQGDTSEKSVARFSNKWEEKRPGWIVTLQAIQYRRTSLARRNKSEATSQPNKQAITKAI